MRTELTGRIVDALNYSIGTLNETISSGKYDKVEYLDLQNELKFFENLLTRIEKEYLDVRFVSREY